MILSTSIPVYPSKSQLRDLDKLFSIGRDFWNFLVLSDINHNLSYPELETLAKIYKNSSEFFNSMHAHLYQTIAKRFYLSTRDANKHIKELPKLKKYKYISSLVFKQYGNGCKISGNKLKFNHLTLRINNYSNIDPECIHTLQLKRTKSGKYFAIVTMDYDSFSLKKNQNIMNNYSNCIRIIDKNRVRQNKYIGVDVGIENLATCSNGICYENPRFLTKSLEDIQRIQKRLEGQVKGSNRYKKNQNLLAKKHEKISNQRLDYNHKVSKEIVLTCGTGIAVEDLDIKDMIAKHKSNHRFNREMMDAAWYLLIFMLEYKCKLYGKEFVKIDPAYTSIECSKCGEAVSKVLSDREHKCSKCGLRMHRDLNAAINIRERGKKEFKKIQARNVPSG